MWFRSTPIIRTDPVAHFPGTEQARWLHDRPLAMPPVRLDQVQPRALARQGTGNDAHLCLPLLDLAVVLTNPCPHYLTFMPRRPVPHQQPRRLAARRQLLAAPLQKLGRHLADGPPIHKPQPDRVGARVQAMPQQGWFDEKDNKVR